MQIYESRWSPIACYLIFLIVFGFDGTVDAQDGAAPAKMRLFLLIGQSNMAGRGKVEPADLVPHPRIFMLAKDLKWVPAKDPVHFDKTSAGVGLCSEFARTLAKQDESLTIGLVPCAVGGTSLDAWKPGAALYTNAVTRTKEAMKSGTLAGILWHQGEADRGKPELVNSYVDRFSTMIGQLRKDLDAERVPVIVGELCQPKAGPEKTGIDAALRSIPERVPLSSCVSAKDLPHDGLHFTAAGLRTFGERYAEAYLKLTKPK